MDDKTSDELKRIEETTTYRLNSIKKLFSIFFNGLTKNQFLTSKTQICIYISFSLHAN